MERGREGWTVTGGYQGKGRERERDDDARKDVKKGVMRGKRDKGQGSLMKVPRCFLSCSSGCPEQSELCSRPGTPGRSAKRAISTPDPQTYTQEEW